MLHAMIREMFFVAAGGALGVLCRFGVGLLAVRLFGKGFPWGTLLVNVAGCFAMGLVVRILFNLESSPVDARQEELFWHRAVAIGFLGGLTTFSTFSADTVLALRDGHLGLAVLNVVASVALCLAAVWCGMSVLPAAR
jgi:CrcB protein